MKKILVGILLISAVAFAEVKPSTMISINETESSVATFDLRDIVAMKASEVGNEYNSGMILLKHGYILVIQKSETFDKVLNQYTKFKNSQ